MAQESKAEVQAKRFTQQWLDETEYEVNTINAHEKQIEIIITGSGDLPPLPELGSDLQATLDPDVQLNCAGRAFGISGS